MSPVWDYRLYTLFYHEFSLMERCYIIKNFHTLGVQGKPVPVTTYYISYHIFGTLLIKHLLLVDSLPLDSHYLLYLT